MKHSKKSSNKKSKTLKSKGNDNWALKLWGSISALEKVIICAVIIAGVSGLYWQRHSSGLAGSKQPSINQPETKNTKSIETTNPSPAPSTTTSPTSPVTPTSTPQPSNKTDCVKLNSDEQSIVDGALQSSYEYYLYQKNTTLNDSSLSDTSKEIQITHDYTSYQWKVEDWQGNVNRTIKGAGCTSTVVAKLQPR